MRYLLLFLISFFCFKTNAQTAWTWEPLADMPARAANNAIAFGTDGENDYVFTFGGIDSTKLFSGINKRSFRYSISANTWEEIDTLPFERTNIASGASTVNNIIYIIGGYHVFEDGHEISTNEVIRYNPVTDEYLTNGTEIPVPIDDHVQCVWRDSLIFVITGWSNTGNVDDVQIYNPALDEWSEGTSTPNDAIFKAFGASGEIIGDTIYYFGGASTGFNFPAQQKLRKGVINPLNPTEIEWAELDEGPNRGYRSASVKYGDNVFWIGGSSTSYNYNGIAYNGSGGVSPLTQIMRYNQVTNTWITGEGAPYGVMDLRGVAQISPTEWIICGGMENDQVVSKRTFRLTYDPAVGNIDEEISSPIHLNGNLLTSAQPFKTVELITTNGKKVANLDPQHPLLPENLKGAFVVRANYENGSSATLKTMR